MTLSSLPRIAPNTLEHAARLALWRGFWSPGGLELTYSVAAAMQLPAGAQVLDAGAGSGESSVFLTEHFGWRITALDADEFGLSLARDKAKHPGLALNTVRANLLNLPFPIDHFDGVFSQGSFFMLGAQRAQAAVEWSRVLKPGGVLGIGEPTLTHAGKSRHSPEQITLPETAALLDQAGLTVHLSTLHPDGKRLWAEFHEPHLDRGGNVRRPGMEPQIRAWQQERELLGLGVLIAYKPS